MVGRAAEVKGPLILETTIPLPDVAGRLEHLAVDVTRKRLFVAETDGNAVDIIDLSTHQRLRRITGLAQPRGLAYLPDGDLLVVANGADGTVRFYRGADFSLRGNVPLGDDANEVLVDPRNGHVLVGYDTSRIAVIDASTPKWLSDIPLPSRAEGLALSSATGHLFVNVPMAGKIVMVDLSTMTGASWLTRGLEGNIPMTLDEESHSVIVVFRKPARLAIVDMTTGAMSLTADTCGDAGGVALDEKRSRLYVSCGAGSMDVIQRSAATLRRVARITTSGGAQASVFVPELDRLYLALPPTSKAEAAIRVYRASQ